MRTSIAEPQEIVIDQQYVLRERLPSFDGCDVYRAESGKMSVVIAFFHPFIEKDDAAAGTFEDRARILCRVSHPKLVDVLDFGYWRGRAYLVTELVPGRRLDVALADDPASLKPIEISLALTDALRHAHREGFTHGAITAASVILSSDGGVKLAGVGVRALEHELDASGPLAAPGAKKDFADLDLLTTRIFAAVRKAKEAVVIVDSDVLASVSLVPLDRAPTPAPRVIAARASTPAHQPTSAPMPLRTDPPRASAIVQPQGAGNGPAKLAARSAPSQPALIASPTRSTASPTPSKPAAIASPTRSAAPQPAAIASRTRSTPSKPAAIVSRPSAPARFTARADSTASIAIAPAYVAWWKQTFQPGPLTENENRARTMNLVLTCAFALAALAFILHVL